LKDFKLYDQKLGYNISLSPQSS